MKKTLMVTEYLKKIYNPLGLRGIKSIYFEIMSHPSQNYYYQNK